MNKSLNSMVWIKQFSLWWWS